MADIKRIETPSIVMLKVALGSAQQTADRMDLAAPLTRKVGDPSSYWYGPDCWYLMSDTRAAKDIVDECRQKLDGILHNAVDYSASMASFLLSGDDATDILASGTGIDLRPSKFAVDACKRTRLAGILAMITAREDGLELFVERSYARYIEDWLSDTASIIDIAAAD